MDCDGIGYLFAFVSELGVRLYITREEKIREGMGWQDKGVVRYGYLFFLIPSFSFSYSLFG